MGEDFFFSPFTSIFLLKEKEFKQCQTHMDKFSEPVIKPQLNNMVSQVWN